MMRKIEIERFSLTSSKPFVVASGLAFRGGRRRRFSRPGWRV